MGLFFENCSVCGKIIWNIFNARYSTELQIRSRNFSCWAHKDCYLKELQKVKLKKNKSIEDEMFIYMQKEVYKS